MDHFSKLYSKRFLTSVLIIAASLPLAGGQVKPEGSRNSEFQALTLAISDAVSRLQTVSDGVSTATYSYLANSPLVGQMSFANNGASRMTTTKQYDYLNRLLSVSSAPSAASALNFNFTAAIRQINAPPPPPTTPAGCISMIRLAR